MRTLRCLSILLPLIVPLLAASALFPASRKPASKPSASPAGPSKAWKLAFVRDGDLWIANGDETGQRLLVKNGSLPRWSPDKQRIAFLRKGEVWIVALSGGQARQVSKMNGKAVDVTWYSATELFVVRESGYRIVYTGGPEGKTETINTKLRDILRVPVEKGSSQLWLGTIRTAPQQSREYFGGQCVGNFYAPRPAPDSRQVAFSKDGDVWTIDNRSLERNELRFMERTAATARLTIPTVVGDESSAGVEQLDWTPDGRRIVYDLQRYSGSGVHEIGILNADGSRRQRLVQVGEAAGGICARPSVSPDGGLIAFQSGSGDEWQIWTVDIRSRKMKRLLSNAEQPDW